MADQDEKKAKKPAKAKDEPKTAKAPKAAKAEGKKADGKAAEAGKPEGEKGKKSAKAGKAEVSLPVETQPPPTPRLKTIFDTVVRKKLTARKLMAESPKARRARNPLRSIRRRRLSRSRYTRRG